MVNIVNGKLKNRKEEERLENLVALACKVFGKERVIKPIPSETLFSVGFRLRIYPDKNEIEVLSKDALNPAIELAKDYERSEGSWTVTTLY